MYLLSRVWSSVRVGFANLFGSQANDPFVMKDKVCTTSNHNGGINGGISNGMPIMIKTAVKPTPSIYQPHRRLIFKKRENAQLQIHGRHDPAIIHRARVVVDSMVAIGLVDLFARPLQDICGWLPMKITRKGMTCSNGIWLNRRKTRT